jgi:hypothetical protein
MLQNHQDNRRRRKPRVGRIAWAIALLSVISFVVSVMAAVSFARRDSLVWGHAEGIYQLQLDRGSVLFFDYTSQEEADSPLTWSVIDASSGPRVGYRGLGFIYKPWSTHDPIFFIGLPLWIAIVPLALADVLCIGRFRQQRHRAAHGLCARCGYDLRATPSACPECGAVPAASRSADSLAKSTSDDHVHGA